MRVGVVFTALLGWMMSASLYADTLISLKFKDYKTGMQTLSQLGVDVAGIDYKNQVVDVISHQGDIVKALEVLNIKFDVLATQLKAQSAPDDGYKTPAEVGNIVEKLAEEYPELVELSTFGTSIEGRPLYVLKISDNAKSHEADEPAVLFNAMHHAREVMTTEVVLDIAQQLLSKYDSDEKVKNWVDTTEIYLVPQVNPDGNHRVWTQDSMWRKNARGDYGVDINRNYPHRWGECNGSSGFKWSQTYRGDSPASEPETKALMGLVSKIRPVFDISYHSYSELVLYPYSCDGDRVETRQIVEGIGQELARTIKSDNGRFDYEPGTSWEILYAVDGGDIDWMYNEYGVIPYVIELNGRSAGFQPPYSLVAPTLEKQRPGWQLLLNRLSKSSIRGYVPEAHVSADTRIVVEGMNGQAYKSTHKVKSDGSFHVILKPGMYKVSVSAPNVDALATEVTVGNDRVDLNIRI